MNINTYSYRELQLDKIGKVYEYCIYSEMMVRTHIFDNDTFRQLYSLNHGKITTFFTVEHEGNIYQIIKQAGHFLNIEKLTNK